MKACPQCGFLPTLSNLKVLKILDAHFPGLPLLEMDKRGWISLRLYSMGGEIKWREDNISELLEHALGELMRFCDVKSVDELKAIFKWEGDLMDTQSIGRGK